MADHVSLKATDTPSATTCLSCDKSGSKTCGGCGEAAYCSAFCQKAHWKEHRVACREKSDATIVRRVGRLARQMYLTLSESFYTNSIRKVEIMQGCVVFFENDVSDDDNVAIVDLPPAKVLSNKNKEVALSIDGCGLAMTWLSGLFTLLLGKNDAALTMREVGLEVKIQPAAARMFSAGPFIMNSKTGKPETIGAVKTGLSPHGVLLVKMRKSKAEYILDLTGSQYGHQEPAKTLAQFKKDCGTAMEDARFHEFGSTARQWPPEELTFSQRRIHQLAVDCASELDQLWNGMTCGGLKLPDAISKPDAVWSKVHEQVLNSTRQHVHAHVAKLHAPDGPLRKTNHGESVFRKPAKQAEAEAIASEKRKAHGANSAGFKMRYIQPGEHTSAGVNTLMKEWNMGFNPSPEQQEGIAKNGLRFYDLRG